MKKNYRIVSAAAAALLAVAPVAASAVSPVFAADAGINVPVQGSGSTAVEGSSISATLNITNATSLKAGAASAISANLTTSAGTGKIVANEKAHVYPADKVGTDANGAITTTGDPVENLEAGKSYIAVIDGVTISGLTANASYTVNGMSKTTDTYGNIATGFKVASAAFTVQDSSKTGHPYFLNGNSTHSTTTAKVPFTSGSNDKIATLASYITTNYPIASTGTTSVSAEAYKSAVVSAIQTALSANGLKVNNSGVIDTPATDFTFPVTVTSVNGTTATLNVTVKANNHASDKLANPVIWLNGKSYIGQNQTIELTDANKKDFASVKVNGTVDTDKIAAAFTVTVNGHTTNTMPAKVDASKVNTKVAGVYPVTVSATNPDGLTSSVDFNFIVGDPNADYKTVQSDSDIPVYTISGNSVTKTTTTIANGTQVATYGQVTVDGKKYVRINSADSNQYVESQYVDGTFKPAKQSTVTVMHNAYIYDKDHKRVGTKKIGSYTNTTVYGDKTKLNDGTEAYQVGDGQYIDAGNVDGYKATLNHNSYIYKTSKKRANHKKLLKGSTVTVYGSSFTFKNGQKYYRIAKGQYIKVVNADIVK